MFAESRRGSWFWSFCSANSLRLRSPECTTFGLEDGKSLFGQFVLFGRHIMIGLSRSFPEVTPTRDRDRDNKNNHTHLSTMKRHASRGFRTHV